MLSTELLCPPDQHTDSGCVCVFGGGGGGGGFVQCQMHQSGTSEQGTHCLSFVKRYSSFRSSQCVGREIVLDLEQ